MGEKPILKPARFVFELLLLMLIEIWRFRLRERGLPFLFTRKNLFTAVLIALIAVVILYIIYQLLQAGLLAALGIATIEGSFIFGLLMSLFYHWSRNILGPIVLHGFWDWQLSVSSIPTVVERT